MGIYSLSLRSHDHPTCAHHSKWVTTAEILASCGRTEDLDMSGSLTSRERLRTKSNPGIRLHWWFPENYLWGALSEHGSHLPRDGLPNHIHFMRGQSSAIILSPCVNAGFYQYKNLFFLREIYLISFDTTFMLIHWVFTIIILIFE